MIKTQQKQNKKTKKKRFIMQNKQYLLVLLFIVKENLNKNEASEEGKNKNKILNERTTLKRRKSYSSGP